MRIVILGAPGVGKGTQGDRLAERCGIPKFATGDILREAVRNDTPLGREAKRYMDEGELVPDAVVLDLVRDALGSPSAKHGFILDGFPRTVTQAEGLQALLAEHGMELDAVVYLDAPQQELIRRVAGRRVCAACGAVYNVGLDSSAAGEVCEQCGGRLETREDDRAGTVRNRLRVYRESTAPLLQWYANSPTPFYELEAVGSVDDVYRRLLTLVDCS
jgi:adenylate kinase